MASAVVVGATIEYNDVNEKMPTHGETVIGWRQEHGEWIREEAVMVYRSGGTDLWVDMDMNTLKPMTHWTPYMPPPPITP
jgi:hypothetical protein